MSPSQGSPRSLRLNIFFLHCSEITVVWVRDYIREAESVLECLHSALNISSNLNHFILGLPPAQSDLDGANFGFFKYSDCFGMRKAGNWSAIDGKYFITCKYKSGFGIGQLTMTWVKWVISYWALGEWFQIFFIFVPIIFSVLTERFGSIMNFTFFQHS